MGSGVRLVNYLCSISALLRRLSPSFVIDERYVLINRFKGSGGPIGLCGISQVPIATSIPATDFNCSSMILRSLQLLDKPLATCIAAPISGEQNDRIGPYVKDAVSHSQLNDFIHGDFIPGVAAAFLFYYIYTQIIETFAKADHYSAEWNAQQTRNQPGDCRKHNLACNRNVHRNHFPHRVPGCGKHRALRARDWNCPRICLIPQSTPCSITIICGRPTFQFVPSLRRDTSFIFMERNRCNISGAKISVSNLHNNVMLG